MAGYKNLDVYNIAYDLSLKVHRMSLGLPQFEKYEEGSQVRRSSKSVCANIVEGFALRKHKNEYLHYLYRAYGSCEETIFHLEILLDSGSASNTVSNNHLVSSYRNLSSKLFTFIQSVERYHETPYFLKKPNDRESQHES